MNDLDSVGRTDPREVRLREDLTRDYEAFGFGPAAIDDNLADLADRRAQCPMSYSTTGGGFWVASEYDAISYVLRRNNRGFVSYPDHPYGTTMNPSSRKMIPIEIDGLEHKQYRTLLDPVFAPKQVALLEPNLRAEANRLIDEFIERGRCDFVKEFAFPFPGITVMVLMGWPLEDAPQMNEWDSIIQHGIDGTEEESEAAQAKAGSELRTYMQNMIEARRDDPRDDVTTLLMQAEINGRRLTDDEVFDTLVLLMLAGLDTVQSTLSQTFLYLAQNQTTWNQIFADPATIDLAVEEFLRWTSPAVPSRTVTAQSMKVGEIDVLHGERVHCPLGAANRDPKYFPDPDAIRFDRPAKPHLTFGLGPHRCIGSHIARIEMRVALEEMRRRIPEFALDGDRPPVQHLGTTWGVDGVHLTFPSGSRLTPSPAGSTPIPG